MRLYNKTLPDIWQEMPRPYQIMVAAGCLFLVFVALYFGARGLTLLFSRQPDGKGAFAIEGMVSANYLDPGIASDGGDINALVYTGIDDGRMRIGLALGNASCARWRWSQDLFTEVSDTLTAPDGTSNMATGTVRYETPSIVYDASDTATPWKAFAYRYFWMNDPLFAQRYSMIVMRRAATPQGPWSPEEWVLATAPDYPPQPYQSIVRGHINPLSPELAGLTGYARPSVVADRSVLLMSLSAFRGTAEIDRVILLASLDHGRSWLYAGTLLTRAQAAGQTTSPDAITRIAGATLMQQQGRLYLAAVLGNDTTQAAGTYIIPIADAGKGQLARTAEGRIAIVKKIPLQSVEPTILGGGYAAYSDHCPRGMITAEHSGTRGRYQLFSTLEKPNGR